VAYIRKLKSGHWNAVVRHPSGRKISKTDPLKRVVQAWAAEQEALFRSGAPVPTRGTFGQWCDRWLRVRSVEPNTARKEASMLRLHIRPHWDAWPLTAIGRLDVQEWVNGLPGRGMGGTAAQGVYSLLATCLADAAAEGLILASPCHRIKLPKATKPEPRWFTADEYERIQWALATRPVRTHGGKVGPDRHAATWQALVGVACYTGLRPAELAGLDIAAVDLERHLIRVRQVLTREGVLRRYGKSDRARRSVPFPRSVGELLWPIMADRPPTAPLFTGPESGRVDFSGNFRARVWVPTLTAAGIEPVRFYVCRHTCASWLVQKGVPDRQIMQILGHADAHLIEVYAHLAPDAHDEVRRAWGEDSWPTSGPRPTEQEVDDERFSWSDGS